MPPGGSPAQFSGVPEWGEFLRRVVGGPLVRSLRYPALLGFLWAFGYVAVVVVNHGRSVAGTLTVAFFVGCGVALAAYFWRTGPHRGDGEGSSVSRDGSSPDSFDVH